MITVISFDCSKIQQDPWGFLIPGAGGDNKIQAVKAREIFDSRGNPTVEVDLCTATAAWHNSEINFQMVI